MEGFYLVYIQLLLIPASYQYNTELLGCHDDHCFYVYPTTPEDGATTPLVHSSWHGAQQFCQMQGMDDITTVTGDERGALERLVRARNQAGDIHGYWIGGKQHHLDQPQWVKGQTEVTEDIQQAEDLNGDEEGCGSLMVDTSPSGEVGSSLMWERCFLKRPFVCEEIDSYQYTVHRENSTWYGAQQSCRDEGRVLASNRRGRLDELVELVDGVVYWVGYRQTVYRWGDDSVADEVLDTLFADAEPSNDNEECLVIRADGKWGDVMCELNRAVFCSNYTTTADTTTPSTTSPQTTTTTTTATPSPASTTATTTQQTTTTTTTTEDTATTTSRSATTARNELPLVVSSTASPTHRVTERDLTTVEGTPDEGDQKNGAGGTTVGLIIGVVVALLLVIVIIVIIIVLLLIRRRKRRKDEESQLAINNPGVVPSGGLDNQCYDKSPATRPKGEDTSSSPGYVAAARGYNQLAERESMYKYGSVYVEKDESVNPMPEDGSDERGSQGDVGDDGQGEDTGTAVDPPMWSKGSDDDDDDDGDDDDEDQGPSNTGSSPSDNSGADWPTGSDVSAVPPASGGAISGGRAGYTCDPILEADEEDEE